MNKALIVGINKYAESRRNLRGCVNDALLMSRICVNRFDFENVNLLLNSRATKLNIAIGLKTLINKAEPGENVLFYFSGHGGQILDTNGDEGDLLDECLITHDHSWGDPFTDDDIKECLVGHRKGVGVTIIIDACHSGTMTDSLDKAVPHPELNGSHNITEVRKIGKKQSNPETQRHILVAACGERGKAYETRTCLICHRRHCGHGSYRRRKQGMMTAVLCHFLRAPRFRGSSWKEIHKAFSDRVYRRSKKKQLPIIYGPEHLLDVVPFKLK